MSFLRGDALKKASPRTTLLRCPNTAAFAALACCRSTAATPRAPFFPRRGRSRSSPFKNFYHISGVCDFQTAI